MSVEKADAGDNHLNKAMEEALESVLGDAGDKASFTAPKAREAADPQENDATAANAEGGAGDIAAEAVVPEVLDAEIVDADTTANGSSTADARVKEVEEERDALSGEADTLKSQLARLGADFENFRKRSRREQEDARRRSIESALLDFLPVLDNLDRALEHASDEERNNPVLQGVTMVARQFIDTLENHGAERFSSKGERFDPARHEAMGQQPTDEVEPGIVVGEIQSGYMINERLLRPARVMVSAALPKADKDQKDPDDTNGGNDTDEG